MLPPQTQTLELCLYSLRVQRGVCRWNLKFIAPAHHRQTWPISGGGSAVRLLRLPGFRRLFLYNPWRSRTTAFALIEHKEHPSMKPKNTICLWFDKDAHEAARFYAATFPDSEVTAVHKAPSDYPGGKKDDVLTVEFTVLGIPCL